jgi:hypothetical protein
MRPQPIPCRSSDTIVRPKSAVLRWGLVPFWANDLKVGFANINAKAEGIETRPAFREAFQRRRCLVPIDSFYEWKKNRDRKAALRDRACRVAADGAGRLVGELALARGRVDAQLRHYHHHAERVVRATPQSHAGYPQT